MATVEYEGLGEVTVYDGTNAAELAELTGTDPAPTPDEEGAITLQVPSLGGPQELALAPGDGLVHRWGGTFLLFGADALATYTVVTP